MEVLRGNGGLMQLEKQLMRETLSSVWVQDIWQGFLYLFGRGKRSEHMLEILMLQQFHVDLAVPLATRLCGTSVGDRFPLSCGFISISFLCFEDCGNSWSVQIVPIRAPNAV